MGETILVVIAVAAALAIAGRRLSMGGSNFPEPLETPADLDDASSNDEQPDTTVSS